MLEWARCNYDSKSENLSEKMDTLKTKNFYKASVSNYPSIKK